MRRIYESDAIERHDTRPFTPRELEGDFEPQSFRYINSGAWSDRLLPRRVRTWALRLSVEVPTGPFTRGEPVPFRVQVRNRLPIPVSVRTASPVLWTWSIDGHEEASMVPLRSPPDEEGRFRVARGDRVIFERSWNGHLRVNDREWVPAELGEHTLAARINTVGGPVEGLYDEVTFHVEP